MLQSVKNIYWLAGFIEEINDQKHFAIMYKIHNTFVRPSLILTFIHNLVSSPLSSWTAATTTLNAFLLASQWRRMCVNAFFLRSSRSSVSIRLLCGDILTICWSHTMTWSTPSPGHSWRAPCEGGTGWLGCKPEEVCLQTCSPHQVSRRYLGQTLCNPRPRRLGNSLSSMGSCAHQTPDG